MKHTSDDLKFENLPSFVNRCLIITPETPLVFFAGSGVSISQPSLLPSSRQMIETMIKTIAPRPLPDAADQLPLEQDTLTNILPEIYYGVIRDLVGDDTLRVWKVLEFWKEDKAINHLGLGPNIAHYLIVFLANQGRVPIITTNFDTLFEEAALRLGIVPVVSTPLSATFEVSRNEKSVAIWKVHGSVDQVESIRTTLQSITMVDSDKLQEIQRQFNRPGTDICFIGYSGRDIDLFPYMISWNIKGKYYWIDPSFDDWHRIYTDPDRFNAIKAPSDEWAEEVFQREKSGNLSGVLNASIPALDYPHTKNKFDELIKAHINLVFSDFLKENYDTTDLIHAISLRTIGLSIKALRYVDRFIENNPIENASTNKDLLIRAYLLKASIYHETSKYIDSEINAKYAYQIAKANRSDYLQDEATIALDEALRMQYIPRINYKDQTLIFWPKTWAVFFRMLFHSIYFWKKMKHLTKASDLSEQKKSFIYIEHLIRLFGSLQGLLLTVFPLSFVRKIMGNLWNVIENQSHKVGFANGVGFARRYAERLGIHSFASSILSSAPIFGFLEEKTGIAISYMDQGNRIMREIQEKKNFDDSLLREATENYEKGYQEAFEIGNFGLCLKIMIGRRKLDVDYRPKIDDVNNLYQNIQGEGYRRLENEVTKWLCGI